MIEKVRAIHQAQLDLRLAEAQADAAKDDLAQVIAITQIRQALSKSLRLAEQLNSLEALYARKS